MNKQQAECLLDAYIDMETYGGYDKARAALREIFVDALVNCKDKVYPYITSPETSYQHTIWNGPSK